MAGDDRAVPLEVIEGTRLEPVRVSILAVTLNQLDRADKAKLRDWRTAQDKLLRVSV